MTEASGAMIECTTFQEALTDYLEGTVCPEVRSACAAHRLSCRECRRLCEQVKESLRLLRLVGDEPPSPRLELANLANRIVLATTPGEMLGCEAFDHLIGQYFDGVIMAPDYQEFQYHFEACARCRRLLATIEEAIRCCQDIGQVEFEMPPDLSGRILSATTGKVGWKAGLHRRARAAFDRIAGSAELPRLIAASLIIAAGILLMITQFGSLEGVTNQADLAVSRGQMRVLRTGYDARASLGQMSDVVTVMFNRPPSGVVGQSNSTERADSPARTTTDQ